ncbi:MAG: ATP-binding protein [Candidatus Omnitrophota bacterium]
MAEKKINILIVGAGEGGRALVELFHDDQAINIVGVVDVNLSAMGIELAKSYGISVNSDYKEFLKGDRLDEIINVTGSEKIQDDLIKLKPAGVEVVGGHSAKLIWDLVEKHKTSAEEIRQSSDIQRAINSLLNLSLQDIPIEELLKKALDIIVSIPWLAFESKGSIFLVEDDPRTLVMKANRGLSDQLLTMCARLPFGRCLCGKAALSGKIIFREHIDKDHEHTFDGIAAHGHFCAPIISSNKKVLGVVNLYVKEGHIRKKIEEEFLFMFGNTLSGIIERNKAKLSLEDAYDKLRSTQLQLIQAEKLSALGTLASGVAHEVKNPLAIIIQGVNYMEKKLSSTENNILEVLKMIKESVKRADNIIMSMLDFSRDSKLTLQEENINLIVDDALSLIKHRPQFEKVEIIKETKQDLPKVIVDKNKIEQVLINLLLNALQAMPEGGKLIIRSYATDLKILKPGVGRRGNDFFKPGENAVIVEIEDTGPGITEENLKKIFDPFFTTKGPKEGAGLGLTITRNIINLHDGLIEIKSQAGKGTKIILTLKT